MMYKDKDKQKEANRRAAQKRRDKAKGMTEGMTKPQGMTLKSKGITIELPAVPQAKGKFKDLPLDIQVDIDRLTAWCEQKGIPDDRSERISRALHYHKLFPGRCGSSLSVIGKPGDADYNGVCTQEWRTAKGR